MTPEVATKILEAVKDEGSIKNTGAAAHILRVWLRALGHVPDNWGNYKLDDATRYKFSPRTMHKQKKGTGGDWYNVLNTPLLDAAINLASRAEQTLGITGGTGQAARQSRSAAQKKSADKAEEQRKKALADQLAAKYMALHRRPETLRFLTDASSFKPEELRELREEGLAAAAMFKHNTEGGTAPDTDEGFASADTPPILPIFRNIPYYWLEKEGGVEYSIEIRHREERTAVINLGDMGSFFTIDPVSMSVSGGMRREPVGDAGISGVIKYGDKYGKGMFVAGLFMIVAKQKKTGAGTRALKLWCRLMRGYGIETWVAEGVGEEGGLFLRRLESKGDIKILGQEGSMWLVACS